MNLPDIRVYPEKFYHRIGTALGLQDINLVHYPEFSRMFLLQGSDEQAIRVVFNDSVLRYFEVNEELALEARGSCAVTFLDCESFDETKLPQVLETAEGLIEKLSKQ